MALKFTVSSPGKVILHGEHSVVFERPAIAGVIGINNHLTLETSNTTNIVLNFELFNGPLAIDLQLYNEFLKKIYEFYGKQQQGLPESINHVEFLNEISKFIAECDIDADVNQKTLQAIIYLLTGILISFGHCSLNCGIILTFDTGITMGAGLGSSASFAVCLSSAFYFYSKLRLTPNFIETFNNQLNYTEQNQTKEIISSWAFCSEKIMHGTPSGLDNTICTYGNIVKFAKNTKSKCIELHQPINVLLINSGVSRSTGVLAKNVAQLKDNHPEIVEHILNAMGALVEDVIKIFESDIEANKSYLKLSKLVVINNNLLRALGVSHPSLERIFSISEKHGFSAKLTGAGGGGYAFVLLPDNYEHSTEYGHLCDDLKKANFAFTPTKIGGAGMEVVQH